MLKKGMLPLVVVAEAGAVGGAGPVSSVFDPWPKSGMPQEISQRVAEWIVASAHSSFSTNKEGTNKKNSLQRYLTRKRNVGDMHGQAPVLLCASAQRLPNGDALMANWLGHGNQFGSTPDLIEVTPDKRVVWTFSGGHEIKTISSALILDTSDVHADSTVALH
jgi:hypothetical protein